MTPHPLQAAMKKLPRYMRDTEDGKKKLHEFAAAVREAALEDAVGICERFAARKMSPEECAAAIRALKD